MTPKFFVFYLILASIEAFEVNLSVPRTNLAATSVNGLALFAGGNNDTEVVATVDRITSNGTLLETTNLSAAREFLTATTVNELAMFAGGVGNGISDVVDIYNSTSGAWTTASLSEPRMMLAATTINNLAIFAGGQNFEVSDRVDIFNATSGSWTTASLSEPRSSLVAVSVGHFALFAGGSNGNNISARVDIYDAITGKWETASLSVGRNWLAAASAGELAAFGGGQATPSSISPQVDIFNSTSKTWSTAVLSADRSYFSATSVGNLIIFGCGSEYDYQFTPSVDILDTTTNTWTIDTMYPARGSLAATSFGNVAFFGGGIDSNGTTSAVTIFTLCSNGTLIQTLACSQTKSLLWRYIVGSVCGGLIVVAVVLFLIIRRRKRGYSPLSQSSIPEVRDVTIKERLGGGQFGDVYRGTLEEGVEVALKKLKSDTDLKEFEREAEILCALNHPNIVRFYGIHKTQLGQKYIVLEYMSEGSLNHFLQRTPQLQLYDLLLFAKHVVAGMRYLGENHIVHRDLACRNLLVATQEQKYVVKVGDFGMSRSAEKGYYTNNEAKIPYKWSAPELIQYGTSTVKGDIWSFGICLWEIFSLGKTPYASWTNRELIPRITSGERLELPENCPNEVYELMRSCWQLDPNARPSFEELADSLQKCINELCHGSYLVSSVLALPSGSTTEMNVYN